MSATSRARPHDFPILTSHTVLPGHAHSDAILLAKTVAVQEQVENVEKVETKVC